ncbi:MAG: DUF4160 domain-containing protein, partial [Kiritimatiellae bacterium]|nr:DUF4160 domain-containing protein [Kiritimatiellia bacterium]
MRFTLSQVGTKPKSFVASVCAPAKMCTTTAILGRFEMGELSRIGSLIIYLRFYDTKQHHKPHVHVKCNEDEAVVALDGEMLSGELPIRQRR